MAQTISYEIRLALIFLCFLSVAITMKLSGVMGGNSLTPLVLVVPVMCGCWFISCLAETNRTPFDFAEGESELVSGFNVEYGSAGFTLIFIREYSMILLFSLVTRLLTHHRGASSPAAIGRIAGLAAI